MSILLNLWYVQGVKKLMGRKIVYNIENYC